MASYLSFVFCPVDLHVRILAHFCSPNPLLRIYLVGRVLFAVGLLVYGAYLDSFIQAFFAGQAVAAICLPKTVRAEHTWFAYSFVQVTRQGGLVFVVDRLRNIVFALVHLLHLPLGVGACTSDHRIQGAELRDIRELSVVPCNGLNERP